MNFVSDNNFAWDDLRTSGKNVDYLTARDRFAMSAMTGLLTRVGINFVGTPSEVAKKSYELADEMMKAREG